MKMQQSGKRTAHAAVLSPSRLLVSALLSSGSGADAVHHNHTPIYRVPPHLSAATKHSCCQPAQGPHSGPDQTLDRA